MYLFFMIDSTIHLNIFVQYIYNFENMCLSLSTIKAIQIFKSLKEDVDLLTLMSSNTSSTYPDLNTFHASVLWNNTNCLYSSRTWLMYTSLYSRRTRLMYTSLYSRRTRLMYTSLNNGVMRNVFPSLP